MDRGASSQLLSGMIWPVCGVLAFAALTLPRQPYTGLMLRGDWVARVEPGGPGEIAGIRPGDRLLRDPALHAGPESPLAGAQPGVSLPLLREREGQIDDVTIIPAPLPAEERRMMAMQLAVASGFLVLGGWLWSERRDRMTRAFLLMCLSFACVLAPFPRFRSPGATLAYETLYSGITLFLPALLVHFFALFPDSTRTRGVLTRITRIAYGVSAGLFSIEALLAVAPLIARHALDPLQELLQSMAALWFGLGTLVAIALFVRSYLLARNEDARRRLRVALAGTVLGFLPLTALVLLRNLFPVVSLPAERVAIMLTLLVPASFAWAAGVYRVFEVRMALRAAVVLGFLLVMSAVVFSLGEWLAGAWRPDLGHGIAGGALAFVVFISAMAGAGGARAARSGRAHGAGRAPAFAVRHLRGARRLAPGHRGRALCRGVRDGGGVAAPRWLRRARAIRRSAAPRGARRAHARAGPRFGVRNAAAFAAGTRAAGRGRGARARCDLGARGRGRDLDRADGRAAGACGAVARALASADPG